MMKLRSLALVLAGSGMLAALCTPAAAQGLRPTPQLGAGQARAPAPSGPRSADFIVVVVNSEPITNNEVRTRLLRYEQQLAQQGSPLPPRPQLVREVVERLISERAQLQEAREAGIKVDDALVDLAEQNVARQNQISVEELRRRIAADGMNVAQFRDDLRSQIMLQRLRDRELEARVKVTEQDIDAFLREQQQGAADPALTEINLSHILVEVPENATPAQVAPLQEKARQLLARARAGEDFTQLAREHSDAPGAAGNGGQVGLRTADRYPPLFVEATRSLPVGGISEVVRSGAGFHIVKVVERRTPGMAVNVTQNHARHILVRPGPQETEAQVRARLAEYKRGIEAGKVDFATLAREHSQDASARNGGDLGWASPGMFVPEFEEVLTKLSPGQVADPVTTRFGVHLIQLLERRETKLSEREQRELVRNLVRERKLDEAYVRWAQEIRGRAFVDFREPPQ